MFFALLLGSLACFMSISHAQRKRADERIASCWQQLATTLVEVDPGVLKSAFGEVHCICGERPSSFETDYCATLPRGVL